MQPDVKRGLGLLADVLLNPAFPEKEIALEKESQLAGIKAEDEEVTSVARNLLKANLFGSHPYGLRGSGTPETIAKLTRRILWTSIPNTPWAAMASSPCSAT